MEAFELLSKTAFTPRKLVPNIPFLSRIHRLLLSWFKDSLYPAECIETALQNAFGDRKILDPSYATSEGVKVGVPVAKGETLCLFTNYNGVGDRLDDAGRCGNLEVTI